MSKRNHHFSARAGLKKQNPRRRKVPKSVQNLIWELSRRRCCICFGLYRDDKVKEGQIAHLNHNPSDISIENLVFLCLPHHNDYDARNYQSRRFSAHEVRKYQIQLAAWLNECDLRQQASVGRVNRARRTVRSADIHKRKIKPLANATPQSTRWGPVDELPAGISVEGAKGKFVPWEQLETEIKNRILPQVGELNDKWSDIKLVSHHGKNDWVIQVLDRAGEEIANVWFGPNPMKNWTYDGLVRVGPADALPRAWQVYQRYSDGSYRRLNPDDFMPSQKIS